MKVFFVMGLPHSGKTKLLDELGIADENIIDVLEIQSLFRTDMDDQTSRADVGDMICVCLNNLIYERLHVKQGEDVYFEFVGTTKQERKHFIEEIRSYAPDVEIVALFVITDEKTRKRRLANEQEIHRKTHKIVSESIDPPDLSEGFSNVYIIENRGVPPKDVQILEQARMHVGYDGHNVHEAIDQLETWLDGNAPASTYRKATETALYIADKK